ncbi:MAG: hypothetical protein QOF60_597 [Actinomycetota bacterium]|nr:hypothetical protein [Actinomycetota bacterium]
MRDFPHWLVVTRSKQVTLGASLFLLKRPVPSFGEVAAEELAELAAVAGWFEEAVIEAFGAERFNYIAAMMKDPWFHFHAIPRYSGPREFEGREWIDQDWPAVATFRDVQTSEVELFLVTERLRSGSTS